ncbi:MAG: sugar phosphate isomerase/epimerase [Clostridia bacterium]|nr:sugar phosphate isomerase/epimerase [Clostridia bacterium]
MILSTQNTGLVSAFGHKGAIDVLKAAGYDAMDMSLFCMSNDDDVFNGVDYKKHVLEIRAYADEKGIPFNQSHAPFIFNWKNPNVYEEHVLPRTARALEISAMLGAKICIVHPISPMEYLGHEEELFERNMAMYRALLPYAKEYDVKIALENMWQIERKRKIIGSNVCSHGQEFARYVDALDDAHFVACLDLGHSGLVAQEAQDAIRILGHDRLKALHVHDNDYRNDMHTLPFLGQMDWDAIMKALADIRYDGEFTFEADAFLTRFPKDYKPVAVKFMVDTGRYLIGRYEHYLAESAATV